MLKNSRMYDIIMVSNTFGVKQDDFLLQETLETIDRQGYEKERPLQECKGQYGYSIKNEQGRVREHRRYSEDLCCAEL